MADGSVFTCNNHRDLRWFNTSVRGRLVFLGRVNLDGLVTPAHPIASLPHLAVLKARIEGRNPFDRSLPDKPIESWDEVVTFVDHTREQDLEWAFECDCPGALLVKLEDEDADELLSREEA